MEHILHKAIKKNRIRAVSVLLNEEIDFEKIIYRFNYVNFNTLSPEVLKLLIKANVSVEIGNP